MSPGLSSLFRNPLSSPSLRLTLRLARLSFPSADEAGAQGEAPLAAEDFMTTFDSVGQYKQHLVCALHSEVVLNIHQKRNPFSFI